MKKQGIVFMIIGGMLIMAAGILCIWNWKTDRVVETNTTKILEKMEKRLQEKLLKDAEKSADKSIDLDGEEYIGILDIPKLNLTLPIMRTCNDGNLQKSPCRYSGDASTNNLVIAAHNYACHFGRLKNLSPEDVIEFTDIHGITTTYQVENMQVVDPMAGDEITSGEYALTLFTCTYDGRARYVVQCHTIRNH